MRKRQTWTCLLAILMWLSAVAPAANAHTALVASDPAAGSTVSVIPAVVTANFDEQLESAFATLTVAGPDGAAWSSGDAIISGSRLSTRLRNPGPSGTYVADYRLMAADGHVVSGSWSFTVAAPAP